MSRRVEFLPHGRSDLERLDQQVQERIFACLERYDETGAGDVKRLQGRPGQFRLRVGKWRVFFLLDDTETVVVFAIDNRGQAY